MTARAWYSTPRASASRDDDDEYDHAYDDTRLVDAHTDYVPDERLGPPLPGSGRKAWIWGSAFVLLALGGAWATLDDQLSWPEWLRTAIVAVSQSLERKPAATTLASTAPPAGSEPSTKLADLDAPQISQSPQAPASANTATLTITVPPPAAAPAAQPPEAYRPPAADPADPFQKRAAAVGLHPELSRVLLERLTPADYRNAGIAIQTAVAETPDSGVLVWPRDRQPELALFQVRFVPGAAPDCRRYVVSITTKDGWLTTALPMEKCGVQRRPARRD